MPHRAHLLLRARLRRVVLISGATCCTLMLISGRFSAVTAQTGDAPGKTDPATKLTTDECQRLYSHQLKILQSDPDNPLYSSVQLNVQVLENSETRKAEVDYCLARVGRASFRCQMTATNLAGLLQCRRDFGPNQNTTPANGNGGETQPAKNETEPGDTYFEDASQKNPDTVHQNGNTGRPETMPSGRLAVTAPTCERAYNHIYGVISKTAAFQKRPDRARLENYWQSNDARRSFAARCLAKFKPEDLGCLLSTQDADVLQGCLLVIPAE